MIFTVQPEQIDALWPQLSPLLEKALDQWTPEAIAQAAREERVQIWGTWNEEVTAVCVTQISLVPRKELNVLGLYGKGLEEILRYLPTVEAWAREQGCDSIRITGRKGWLKLLEDYKQCAIVLEKTLNV